MKKATQTPQLAMKVQQKLTRYGVVPVASLAGAAPGPVPRTDPPSATGQREEQTARQSLTYKTHADGKPIDSQNQTPISAGTKERKRKPDTLNILQFNASGIRTKKTELAYNLDKHKIHIAMIQESEIGKNTEIHISNYTTTRCSCLKCQGTITFIRNDIPGHTENLDYSPTCIQKSTIWHSEEKYSVYNIYNPPAKEIQLPSSVTESGVLKKTILAGDFNGHSPQWGYPDLNNTGKVVEEVCCSTNLCLVQDSSTQPTLMHRVHKTLHRPDLTLVSSDLLNNYEYEVIDGIGDSDHRPMITKISSKRKAVFKPKTRWNFKRASWDIYKETSNELLSKIDMTSGDTEKMYDSYTFSYS